jgi:hypothetical protein
LLFANPEREARAVQSRPRWSRARGLLGNDCKPMYQLVAQVYDFQNFIQDLFEPVAIRAERRSSFQETARLIKKQNTAISNFLKRQSITPA